ncbi:MAG: DUF7529 family protein [archaeon]
MERADPGEHWGDVVSDSDATATAYRERGWTAVAVHPGHVNPVADAGRIDVLLPGSEFETVNAQVAEADVDTVRVYTAATASVEYRLVVAEDEDASVAVCVPTYVGTDAFEALRQATTGDALTIRLRPLDDRDVVEIDLPDPSVFFDATGEA